MNLTEKSAYLKGLAEGMNLDDSSNEGKLIRELIELTMEMSEAVSELEERCDMLNDYAEELDEDLGQIEEIVFDLEEEGDDYDCGGCCDCGGEDSDAEDSMRCAICPGCGDAIYFDENVDSTEIVCPSCGKHLAENDGE